MMMKTRSKFVEIVLESNRYSHRDGGGFTDASGYGDGSGGSYKDCGPCDGYGGGIGEGSYVPFGWDYRDTIKGRYGYGIASGSGHCLHIDAGYGNGPGDGEGYADCRGGYYYED